MGCLQMKSIKFEFGDSLECVDKARMEMENTADRLIVHGCRIVSVVYCEVWWILFYEEQTPGPDWKHTYDPITNTCESVRLDENGK